MFHASWTAFSLLAVADQLKTSSVSNGRYQTLPSSREPSNLPTSPFHLLLWEKARATEVVLKRRPELTEESDQPGTHLSSEWEGGRVQESQGLHIRKQLCLHSYPPCTLLSFPPIFSPFLSLCLCPWLSVSYSLSLCLTLCLSVFLVVGIKPRAVPLVCYALSPSALNHQLSSSPALLPLSEFGVEAYFLSKWEEAPFVPVLESFLASCLSLLLE